MAMFSSASPLILNNFDEATVFTVYKLTDHFWTCLIHFVVHHALYTVSHYFVNFIMELIKFGLILLLTGTMGFAIFRLWESSEPPGFNILSAGSSKPPEWQSLPSSPRSSYPYLVEMPSRLSSDLQGNKKLMRPKKKDDKVDEQENKTPTPSVNTMSSAEL